MANLNKCFKANLNEPRRVENYLVFLFTFCVRNKKRYNFVSRIIVFTGDFLSMDSMPIVVFLYLEDAPRMIEAADQIIK